MAPVDIEAVLQAVFSQCEAAGVPLNVQQREILQQTLIAHFTTPSGSQPMESPASAIPNPLEELTPEQRQTLLEFIHQQDQQSRSWKITLLNDWLTGRESGPVQFVRELYGLSWLERVQPIHLVPYSDERDLKLKVGDRIEVANSLWEWVQDDGPCSREWIPCTIIGLSETLTPANGSHTTGTIRFDNGMEYEIQGIYEWNRYNWRWLNS